MFSAEEEKLIREQFDVLVESCRECFEPDEEDVAMITSAFEFAHLAHIGVRRKSGEPYIYHPIAVAQIVVTEVGLGTKSVVASLLHDVVEDTDYTVDDIAKMFGDRVAIMVDGLTKMKKASDFAGKDGTYNEQAENFKKMLLTLSEDVRVIMIKLADRLHNMRTLDSMAPHKQVKIASETIYLFAPLAHRLGLYLIKTELEDLSLKFSFPEDYKAIKQRLEQTETSRQEYIARFNSPIIDMLNKHGIEYEITGRVKSPYSIWKKMQRKDITLEEVFDLFAVRVVFKPAPFIPEKSQCWHVYSLITDIYKPKPDRLRDWINIPKANGYESLHCTVMGPDGMWAEVQIRSQRMNDIAERGFAAHWKYKEYNNDSREGEIDKWIKEVRNALNWPTQDAVEFLDEFKLNLYASEVVVFTPKGETRTLAKGAVVLDLAYEIHTRLGNKAIGAKVNHKIQPLDTVLMNGDQVEILTSNNAVPKVEWLKYVVTAKAQQCIKSALKGRSDDSVKNGIQIFDKALRGLNTKPTGALFKKVLPAYDCSNKEEFYSKLGSGIITLDGLDRVVKSSAASKIVKYWSVGLSKLRIFGDSSKNEQITDLHIVDDISYIMADCCSPIPGDDVMGHKDGNIITVHKKSCPNAIKLVAQDGANVVPIEWSSQKVKSYLTHLEIRGLDRIGILVDLSHLLTTQLGLNIRKLHVESHDGIFEGYVTLYVRSRADLQDIINKLSTIKSVGKVKRVDNIIM